MSSATGPQASLEARLSALEDRSRILEVLHAYCRFVDLLASKDVAGLFTEDCQVDYGPGLGGPISGRQALARALDTGLRRFAATSHHLSNAAIDLDGDHASATSYVLAWHQMADGSPDAWIAGSYEDRLVKEDGDWLISGRRLLVANESGFPVDWNWIERRWRPERGAGAEPGVV